MFVGSGLLAVLLCGIIGIYTQGPIRGYDLLMLA